MRDRIKPLMGANDWPLWSQMMTRELRTMGLERFIYGDPNRRDDRGPPVDGMNDAKALDIIFKNCGKEIQACHAVYEKNTAYRLWLTLKKGCTAPGTGHELYKVFQDMAYDELVVDNGTSDRKKRQIFVSQFKNNLLLCQLRAFHISNGAAVYRFMEALEGDFTDFRVDWMVEYETLPGAPPRSVLDRILKSFPDLEPPARIQSFRE